MASTKTRRGQRGKPIEEVTEYATGHRIRVQALTLLNEGTYSTDELARLIGEPKKRVAHHLNELLEGGSIELAKVEKVRGAERHFYRAVVMPIYTAESLAAMTGQQQRVVIGQTIQHIHAEVMSAFWAGKMTNDPQLCMLWRWFNLDPQGREDLVDEMDRHWSRVQQIEAESTNRRAESGEEASSIVVASLGFERERSAPVPPPPADAG